MNPFTLPGLSIAIFLLSCNVYQRKPEVSSLGDRPILLEEAKLPSIDPCAVCVGYSATKRYESGNIRWFTCLRGEKKVYLDIKLTKPNHPELKLRLMRDCIVKLEEGSNATLSAAYMKCYSGEITEWNAFTIYTFEETDDGKALKTVGLSLMWQGEDKIFGANLNVNALTNIFVKEGWQLYYGTGKGCKRR